MLSPSLKAFHDKVYVLTTRRAEERHRNCIEQLGEGNFEFFYGIDKRDVTREGFIRDGVYDDDMARKKDQWGRSMTLGHICCALGHRMICEDMLRAGYERVLIFEDDVVDLGFPEAEIAAALEAVPADAELVWWGWSHGKLRSFFGDLQNAVFHVRRFFGRYRYNHQQISNLYMRRYNEHFHVSAGNYLLHAYTITRRGAQTIVDVNTPVIHYSDHAPVWAILDGKLRGYVSLKQFFGQRSIDPTDPMESITEVVGPDE